MASKDVDAPPAKRVCLDDDHSTAQILKNMDDFNDTGPAPVPKTSIQNPSVIETIAAAQSTIPGLRRLWNALQAPKEAAETLPQPVVAEGMKEIIAEPPSKDDGDAEMSGMESIAAASDRSTEISLQPSIAEEVEENLAAPPVNEEPNAEISGLNGKMSVSEDMEIELGEIGNTTANPNSASFAPEDADPSNTESQPITLALEALLGGLDTHAAKAPESANEPAEAPAVDANPEWEVDSSPYESSSDDSSSGDSSDDSSEEGDNAYKLLSPEEQARILMEGDGGSDDEGGAAKTKGAGGQLRTKNEVPEEIIPKPDVVVTPEMRIEELGAVMTIVENIILIKAKISGEYRVLESGSVLCLEDRSVFGVVSETLGRVQQPLYTVRFTNGGEITEAGLSSGTKVFYSEPHAKFALTQALKAYKGSDASNLHDEEVGDEEVEFSDDEAEADHKKRSKQKKLAKRVGKMSNDAHGYGHPLQQSYLPTGNGGLSYDDAEDEGPYKPLARPIGFADTVGRNEAPQEGEYTPGMSNRGRGDFRGRGRGDRGRGRGDRGRGRGGFQDRRDNNSYLQAPRGGPQHSPASSQTIPPYNPAFSQSPAAVSNTSNNYNPQSQNQYPPQQPMWPQFPQQWLPQQFQGFQNMQNGWPNMPPPPPLPSGAFINPAFFAGNQQGAPNQWQQGQPNGRGRGSSS